MVAIFNRWACPRTSTRALQARLGAYHFSPCQQHQFEHLTLMVLPLCRLTPDHSGLGRGQHTLNSYLTILEGHLHDNSFKLPAPLSTVSFDVDPSRISLPTTVGSANPQHWLPSQVAALLADPAQLQLPRDQWRRAAACE